MIELIDTVEVGNELGEGVIWDHQRQKVWWTDIQRSILYRYDINSKALEQWNTPERLACFAPIEGDSRLVAAFESGFAFYSPETAELEWIKRLEQNNPGTRFNDGRTDRQGRLWAGTMVENSDVATEKGYMYCLHHNLEVTIGFGNLHIPNSLCWSPDGKTAYHTDTPSRIINRYPYNTLEGFFGEPELFVKTERECFPDGSIIDDQGFLWNAQWGGSQVVRYSPRGEVNKIVKVPTSQPSCVAFGGENLNLLMVTSAKQNLDKPDSQAGNLFLYQTDMKGLTEQGFVIAT